MSFTKNTPLKLRELGFEFAYKNTPFCDCEYEVYKRKISKDNTEYSLEATIDQPDNVISFSIIDENDIEFPGVKSITDLKKLISFLEPKKVKYINNEEGD